MENDMEDYIEIDNNSIYNQDFADSMREDDEISDEEHGFMQGYNEEE